MRRSTAGRSRNWCSQTRITRQPVRLSWALFNLSLRRFRSILAIQYAVFELGVRSHCVHPCQKHPSTKIRSFRRRKAKSGRPGISSGCKFHPRTPFRTRQLRSRHSVDRFPYDLTRPITQERVSRETESTSHLFTGFCGGDRGCELFKALGGESL